MFQDFEKRQALDECFKLLREKQEVLFIKTLIYKEHVIQKDQKTEMKIHMNINVKMNMISQRFIIKQSMSLLNIDFSRSIWMNDQNVYCYDVYKMCYWLRDSWSIKKKDINIFYAINCYERIKTEQGWSSNQFASGLAQIWLRYDLDMTQIWPNTLFLPQHSFLSPTSCSFTSHSFHVTNTFLSGLAQSLNIT